MTPREQIRIHEILLDREAALVRIAEIETAIVRLAGTRFPLPPPPDLPSRRKRARRKRKPRAARATALIIPPLEDGETAYRVRYHEDGIPTEELHLETKAIEGLLSLRIGNIRVDSVETTDPSGELRRRLYTHPDCS